MTEKYTPLSWIKAVVRHPDLPLAAKSIGVNMAMYANKVGERAHPGHERLAAEAGCSVPTVKRAIKSLEEAGLVVKTMDGRTTPHRNWANVYRLLMPVRDAREAHAEAHASAPDHGSLSRTTAHVGADYGSPVTPHLSLGNYPSINCSESDDSGPTLARRTRAPNPDDLDESGEGLIEWLEEQHGGLDVMETNTALGMWGDDRHPLMISNTIEKMRSWG